MKSAHTIAVALAFNLVACAGSSSQWNPESTASLRAQPTAMLADLDAGNFDAMLGMLDDDAIVLDLDENNHPVRYQGRANVSQYFKNLEQAAKTQGLKFKSTIVRNDCSATANIGYCVVEFDQTISAGGQTQGPFRFRATIVSRKVGNEWRLAHWHGSFREMPVMPAPSGPTAAK